MLKIAWINSLSKEHWLKSSVLGAIKEATVENEIISDVENILKAQNSAFKVGTQKGTTGYMYSAGDADFGYDGFTNLETKAYDTGALAMQDLKNGKINAVILDKQPSLMITSSMNK